MGARKVDLDLGDRRHRAARQRHRRARGSRPRTGHALRSRHQARPGSRLRRHGRPGRRAQHPQRSAVGRLRFAEAGSAALVRVAARLVRAGRRTPRCLDSRPASSTTAARIPAGSSSPASTPSRTSCSARLSRVADAPVECVCAGRTDAGVHALRPGGALRQRRRAQRARLAPRRQHLSTRRRERRLGARSAGAFPRALQRRWRAAIAISSSIAIRVRRWPPGVPPGSAARSMRRACTRPRRCCSANTTSARFAPSSARRSRRCAASSSLAVTRQR